MDCQHLWVSTRSSLLLLLLLLLLLILLTVFLRLLPLTLVLGLIIATTFLGTGLLVGLLRHFPRSLLQVLGFLLDQFHVHVVPSHCAAHILHLLLQVIGVCSAHFLLELRQLLLHLVAEGLCIVLYRHALLLLVISFTHFLRLLHHLLDLLVRQAT